jgi:hypothetical protein
LGEIYADWVKYMLIGRSREIDADWLQEENDFLHDDEFWSPIYHQLESTHFSQLDSAHVSQLDSTHFLQLDSAHFSWLNSAHFSQLDSALIAVYQ